MIYADISSTCSFMLYGNRNHCDAVSDPHSFSTGESFPNDTPDGIVGIAALENGALLSFQIEGGKFHNSGSQIDITGVDLKISNPSSFGHADDNLIEGGQGAQTPFVPLPIPDKISSRTAFFT